METRANFVLVGLFTLAVLGAAFGFVSWFSGLGGSSDRREVRIVFSGSVTGLTRGSSVLFNGLRVGEVKDIQLFPDDPRSIYAVIDVANSTPIRNDTRARIESQGLAGVVAIQLLGGKVDAPALQAREGQALPTIIAERSEVQDLLETVRNVARRTDDLFERLGRFVDDNDKSIATTIRNVEKFSAALGDNADGVNKML
ncbi:MAG: MlaD family protein, partial [Hyphomicrobiales bacterium]|nr:MlaD family protein [Hyphomicrobiales bacterium]